ncbi:methylornithine synthase PylB [Natroniella sulfidigena]|uniref:methylornithine synthase PylB n=1 Tax=Natroniella sulfidigena TaxID=723921 RepID=UPI00200AE790|nr:methylornithine synthase PylB [Natroniella sulfidigena]MCK8817945.1 methylornithine synthase PylB [Natroniella sulfidigena]
MTTNNLEIKRILNKALNRVELKQDEIYQILNLKDQNLIEQVFATARKIRSSYFGNKLFLYGFVYFSTYCQNECSFCYYRNSNQQSPRYRKSIAETVEISKLLAESGVHLIDLTMGEDPIFYQKDKFEDLSQLVREIKVATGLPVMISPGLLPRDEVLRLTEAGADLYACYQETHSPELFKQLRVGQDYQQRLEIKKFAQQEGMLIEDGILLGVGEGIADRVNSILTMKELGVHQGRVMSFVSQEGTPMEDHQTPSRINELLVIAVLRLVLQDRLIPASLDVDGIKGLKDRLMAGANVITSIIPPQAGLAGVSNSTLDIEEGYRTVTGVKQIIEDLELEVASKDDYQQWIAKEQTTERYIRSSSC